LKLTPGNPNRDKIQHGTRTGTDPQKVPPQPVMLFCFVNKTKTKLWGSGKNKTRQIGLAKTKNKTKPLFKTKQHH